MLECMADGGWWMAERLTAHGGNGEAQLQFTFTTPTPKMATLGEKFEEFCTSLKASPPAWVRAEIDGAAT
eukprot:COSAG01_NODE_21344_length_906_cov_1.085502_1_plen_70_part_00